MLGTLIYQSVVIILLLTFSFGPAFFALINAGIKDGTKKGSLLALGIVLSDLFVSVCICILFYVGAESVLKSEGAAEISAVIGGSILIIFGVTFFLKRNIKEESSIESTGNKGTFFLVVKGFFLNLFNPSVWFLWLGNVSVIGPEMNYSLPKMISYFFIVLAVVFAIEVGKVVLAGKIKHFLTQEMMRMVNYITGAALIVFGLILIIRYFI